MRSPNYSKTLSVFSFALAGLLTLLCQVAVAANVLTSGSSHSGTLTSNAAVDSWVLAANVGDRILLQAARVSGASFNPYIRLFDSNNTLVASDYSTSSAALSFAVTQGGTYRVEVSESGANTTGSYQLYFVLSSGADMVPSGDQGGSLTNGASHSGSIALADLDTWSFQAGANDAIHVQIAEVGSSSFDPYVRVYSPDGSLVASDYSSASASLAFNAAVGGKYKIVISDGSSHAAYTGNYNLIFAQSPGNFTVPVGDQGGNLTNGGEHAGSLSVGDIDMWSFSANANSTIRLQVGEVGATNFSPYLLIYGPDGSLVASDYSSSAAAVSINTLVGGNYTVLVRDANSHAPYSGDYKLYFSQMPQSFSIPAGDQGGTLTNGGIHNGSISLADMDMWSFSAVASDVIRLQVGEVGSSGFSPYILVYGPDGNLIESDYSSTAAAVTLIAPVAGSYRVVVQDGNTHASASGDYNLFYLKTTGAIATPVGDQGGSLQNGIAQSGSISTGDMDAWTFTADANDAIRLQVGEMGSSSFTPYILVYRPDGSLLTTDYSSTAASVGFNTSIGGTYLVVVQDGTSHAANAGDYQLYFSRAPGSYVVSEGDQGGTLNSGVAQAGNIPLGDMDTWTLTLDANDTVAVQLNEVGSSAFTPYLLLYGPGGSLITSDYGSAAAVINATVASAGNYTLIVQDGSSHASGAGDYTLNYTRTANTISLPVGASQGTLANGNKISSNVNAPTDIDKYDLSVQAGDKVRLQVGDLDGTGYFSPVLRVFSSGGQLIAAAADSSLARVSFIAPSSDTLKIVIFNSLNYTGTYPYELYGAISAQSYSTPPGDQGGTLSNGLNMAGSLAHADIDLFSLAVNTGENINLQLGDIDGTGYFSPVLEVYRADGSLLARSADASLARVKFIATANETLRIHAYNSLDYTGSYPYSLYTSVASSAYTTAASDQGGELSNGLVTSGSLAHADVDIFTLPVSSGSTINLQLGDIDGTGYFSPIIEVYRANGELLAQNASTSLARVEFAAVANETVRVHVYNALDYTGTYPYSLFTSIASKPYTTATSDQGGNIANGNQTSGSLSHADVDLFSLPVSAGDKIRLQLGDINGTGYFSPLLRVYRASGELLALSNDGSLSRLAFTAPATETLQVQVLNSLAYTGVYPYQLYTAVAAKPYTVPAGDQGGTLSNGVSATGALIHADVDHYSFAASANTLITVQVTDTAGTGYFSPKIEVFDASGQRVAYSSGGTSATVNYLPASAGTLTLLVSNGLDYTGSYDYSLVATGISAILDTDNDGLADGFELQLGTSTTQADTDGDGLSDYTEVNYDDDPSQYQAGVDLDPLNADTDGDGTVDGLDATPLGSITDKDIPFLPIWAYPILMLVFGRIASVYKQRA